MNIFKVLLNIFIPIKCPICLKWIGIKEENPICKNCFNKLEFSPKDEIIKGIEIYSISIYKENIKKLIHEFKYNKNLFLGKFLAKILKEKIAPEKYKNFDFIVPVPLHRKKLEERGFNQSEIFASFLSKKLKIPLKKKFLLRIKETKPQVDLKKEERKNNIKDAFRCKKDLTGKNVILVDDVFTTGATVKECIKELKMNGAKKIKVIVFARPEKVF